MAMTGTQRMRALVEKQPVDRIGVSGWVHMPMVDHNVHDMVKATIHVTDYLGWDFVKIMSTGHYVPEAFGGDITLSKDLTHWYGTINRYPIQDLEDLKNFPVLDMENPVFQREVAIAKELAEHYKGNLPVLATIFTPLTCLQEMMSRGTSERVNAFIRENPKEVHAALERLVQTNFNYLDALMDAGIDGIFFANQYSSRTAFTPELFREYCAPYDKMILDHIKDRTWFNILHVHGEKQLMFEECIDYNVQAFSWENCAPGVPEEELASVRWVRSMTDKVLITGLARHYDYYSDTNDRTALKELFRRRLLTVLEESGDKRVVFAPGCALPMDVDRYIFTLMKEVVEEEGILG